MVSPLARRPLLPKSKLLVAGAVYDRVTSYGHAERLATHFDCELMPFKGGHILQLGRSAVWSRFEALWNDS